MRNAEKYFFSDETWMDSKMTFRKYQQGPGILGVMNTVSGDNRLAVVHTGSMDNSLCNPSWYSKQIVE